MFMKCVRKISWMKNIAKKLFDDFGVKDYPKRMVLMKALPHKPTKRFGKIDKTSGNGYIIKIRNKFTQEGHLEKCSKEQMIKGLCCCVSELSQNNFDDIFNEARGMLR